MPRRLSPSTPQQESGPSRNDTGPNGSFNGKGPALDDFTGNASPRANPGKQTNDKGRHKEAPNVKRAGSTGNAPSPLPDEGGDPGRLKEPLAVFDRVPNTKKLELREFSAEQDGLSTQQAAVTGAGRPGSKLVSMHLKAEDGIRVLGNLESQPQRGCWLPLRAPQGTVVQINGQADGRNKPTQPPNPQQHETVEKADAGRAPLKDTANRHNRLRGKVAANRKLARLVSVERPDHGNEGPGSAKPLPHLQGKSRRNMVEAFPHILLDSDKRRVGSFGFLQVAAQIRMDIMDGPALDATHQLRISPGRKPTPTNPGTAAESQTDRLAKQAGQ